MLGVDPIEPSVTQALQGLSMQLEAGVQLDKALRSAGEINRTAAGRHAFAAARERAMANEPFEKVIEAMSAVLSYAERAVLAAGWDGGKIDFALKQVVRRREVMHVTRREVRHQLILPGVVLLGAAFIAPMPALLLGGMSLGMYLVTACTPPGLAAAVYVTVRAVQRGQARKWADRGADAPPPPTTSTDILLLTLPGVRRVQRLRNQSEFALLMANLLGAGLGILDALSITARTLPNGVYRTAVTRARGVVERGEPLSTTIHGGVWPAAWHEAMKVGEVTGDEDRVLARLGEVARTSYLEAVRAWGKWLPRVVYAVVSFYVAVQVLRGWSAVLGRGV